MRPILSLKQTPVARGRHGVVLRLETLEDRCLLSGSAGTAPDSTTIVSSLKLHASQEIVLPDGKILLGENLLTNGTVPMDYSGPVNPDQIIGESFKPAYAVELARLNADGSLDTTFGSGGIVIFQPNISDTFANFALQPDGKIVVVGAARFLRATERWRYHRGPCRYSPLRSPQYSFVWQDSGLLVARFNADGSLDTTFATSGPQNIPGLHVASATGGITGGIAGAVTVQPDGKIIVVAGERPGIRQLLSSSWPATTRTAASTSALTGRRPARASSRPASPALQRPHTCSFPPSSFKVTARSSSRGRLQRLPRAPL